MPLNPNNQTFPYLFEPGFNNTTFAHLQQRLEDSRTKFSGYTASRETLNSLLTNRYNALSAFNSMLENAVEAREITSEAAVETQQNLQFHIESLVNTALRSVWGDEAYTFKANFVRRHNQVECDLRLVRGDTEIEPLEASGGGVCDVVSMALRMVYHGLGTAMPVMIYDEPLRHLSEDMQERAAEMRNALCKHLGLQFIIITHSDTAILGADRIFRFQLVNGQTQVSIVENDD